VTPVERLHAFAVVVLALVAGLDLGAWLDLAHAVGA